MAGLRDRIRDWRERKTKEDKTAKNTDKNDKTEDAASSKTKTADVAKAPRHKATEEVAAATQQKDEPTKAGTSKPEAKPEAAPHQKRVESPKGKHAIDTPTPTYRGGTMTHPIREAAEQAKAAAVGYKPETLQKYGRDLVHLPGSIRDFADSIDLVRRHGDEYLPVNKHIIEQLSSAVKLLREAAKATEELPGAYMSMHETDEARMDSPRGGSRVIEARADVSRAQDEI